MTQPADPERLQWLSDRTMRLLCAAMDRDGETVTNLMAEMADRYNAAGIYGVCCALSETIRQFAFPTLKRGDGTLTGDMLAIEKLPGAKDDPHTQWACRFVVAYINGDSGNTDALFFGTIDDEDLHTGGVVALIAMAADIARQVEAERAA